MNMEHIRCMCCEDGDDEAGYVCEECRKAYPSEDQVESAVWSSKGGSANFYEELS